MDKTTAQSALQKAYAEIFSLNPSTIIELFEIDATDLLFDLGVISNADIDSNTSNSIFRFHNNVKLINTSLYWQGNEYIAAPIQSEGFELTSSGPNATPKIRITTNEENIGLLSTLKSQIYQMGDLVGAKLTRIKTFAKYLDARNFLDLVTPEDFEPDTNVELSRSVFFIEQKTQENKFLMEYELSSVLDLEGLKLPSRLVVATKCQWAYRGEGCLYEYDQRRVASVHGDSSRSTLPNFAPPIANEHDELLRDIVQAEIVDKGEFNANIVYGKGQSIYIQKNGIKYYFTARIDSPPSPPPNLKYWVPDNCSKTVSGCKLRWNPLQNTLPFGGFPAANRLEQSI